MPERKTCLRILYTINGSPQYILARSVSPVSVTTISPEEDSRVKQPDIYANVSLKACLDTIRRSSPELTQDSTRDFSLYLLDPLEMNSVSEPVSISSAHGETTGSANNAVIEQPRRLAVALGLMSLGLTSSDRDPIHVTGTWVKQPTGQEALEVVFGLREMPVKQRTWDVPVSSLQALSSSQESVTSEMNPPQWYSAAQEQSFINQTTFSADRSASTSDLTRETVASIQMRTKAKAKPPKSTRHSNTPVTESDKLMNAGTYIGPLKKKGRPKTANAEPRSAKTREHLIKPNLVVSQREVIVLDASDNENNGSSQASDSGVNKKHAPQQPRPSPFATAPLTHQQSQQTVTSQRVQSEKGADNPFDPLALLSASLSSVDPTISNAALLTALATIDSSKDLGAHEDSKNAALIAALQQLLALCTKPTALPKASSSLPTTAPEVDVHHLQFPQSDTIVVLDKENVNPVASRKYCGKNGLDKFSDPLPFVLNSSKERSLQSLRPSTRANEVGLTNISRETTSQHVPFRKRTLSDFMDESESGRRGKGKEREARKVHNRRRNSGQPSESVDAMRHYPQVLAANLPRSGEPSNYYRTALDSQSSPTRGRTDNAENMQFPNTEGAASQLSKNLSLRNRQTISASSPIRSKEVPKKYIVPHWARTNTATKPRLSEETTRAIKEAEAKKREERNAARRKLFVKECNMMSGHSSNAPKVEPPATKSDLSQGPISASNDGPVIPFPLVAITRASSPLPAPVHIPRSPKTPSKNHAQTIPEEEDGSLFTPVSASGSAGCGSAHAVFPSVLTSPLGNRKKARVSPIHSISGITAWSTSSSPKTSTDSVVWEVDSNLGRESEDPLDDLDCPPGSLPIASSDIDVDCSYSKSTGGARDDTDDDSEVQTVKQHWAGLPPSSPPPPSSPMLVPENRTDDEDMDELPIATSDSEADADMSLLNADGISSAAEGEATQRPMNLTADDFTALFSMENNPSSSMFQLSSSTTLDLFEQFTNVNAQSDDILPSPNVDDGYAMFSNGIDLDFTQFWDTLIPMVDGNTYHSHQDSVEQDFSEFFAVESGEVDHAKLAQDMQSLLSGCLL